MSKRFSETTKWDDPWYRRMKPKFKAFFQFLCDRCDQAGVWVVDMDLAATFVGDKIDASEAIRVFDGRVVNIGRGKWLIPQFVTFQNGKLSPSCHPHKRVIEALNRHHLMINQDGIAFQCGSLGRVTNDTLATLPTRVVTTLEEGEEYKEGEEEELSEAAEKDRKQSILKLPVSEPEIDLSEMAQEIWALYPRKDGKAKGIESIQKAFAIVAPIELRRIVELFAIAVAQWGEQEKQFVPHCSTFMNQKRWQDDPATWIRNYGQPNSNSRNGPNRDRNAAISGADRIRADAVAADSAPDVGPWMAGEES